MQLNHDQSLAVERAVTGFLEEDLPGITFIGEGGTGKSTCVMQAAERLLAAGLKVLFTAPTNKAVKQLEKSARRAELGLDNVAFMTLHAALGLALLPSEENKFAHRMGKGVFELYDVVVVDEVSMLGRRALHDYLLPDAAKHNVKLLFMGDDMQLPPVREKVSAAFEIFEVVRLTIVERQAAGSEILTVNGLLRTAISLGNRPFMSPAITVGGAIEVVKTADFLQAVLAEFDASTDLDEIRVLAWRNQRVDDINAAIRRKIYGKGAARFQVGERIVTGAPIGDGEQTILSTDEECIVREVRESQVEDEATGQIYKTWLLVLEPLHANVVQVFAQVLHESEEARYWDYLNGLASKAKASPAAARGLWARYHAFKELFATIRYCYCITVHRSQGSTYRRVLVDVKDILMNSQRNERQSLLYVAYSRPSQSLVINKGKYVA